MNNVHSFSLWFTVHHICSTAHHCVDLIAYLKFLLKSITSALESQLFFIDFITHRFCHDIVHSHHILQIIEVYLPVGFYSEYCHLDLGPSSLECSRCSCRSRGKVCSPSCSWQRLVAEERGLHMRMLIECSLPSLIYFFTASDPSLRPAFFRRMTHLTTHIWLFLSPSIGLHYGSGGKVLFSGLRPFWLQLLQIGFVCLSSLDL